MALVFSLGAIIRAEPADPAVAMQLLKNRCFSCHNEEKAKGGLVMTSQEKLLKGGDDGAVVVAGEPEKSAIITSLVEDADPHMPPKKQLSPEQIATLTAWVKAGAVWDADALISKPRTVALAPLPANYQPVFAVELSPDGKRLAAACGGQLSLFDVADKSLNLVAHASAHPDPIQSLAWSPDGTRIATGAFRRVVIWNAAELSAERVLRDELTDRISALRFTSDGAQLVIADGSIGERGTIHLVDAKTGARKASWNAHTDTIADIAISPDGKTLATAGADKLVKLWDLASQKESARIEAHATQVLTVRFNPEGTRLVTGGADQQLKGWDVKTKEQVMVLGKHSAALSATAWISAGPTLFAVTEDGAVLRYSDFKAHSGAQSSDSANERKFETADTTLHCMTASNDGQRLFAGTSDGRVLGWNKDGKIAISFSIPANTAATAR
jgi:WD40 repeat protein